MKNLLIITSDGEQLVSSIHDTTNRLLINDVEISNSLWVGDGYYTDTVEEYEITIAKAPDLDGDYQLVKLSDYRYSLLKTSTGGGGSGGVTGVKGNAESSYRTGQVNLTPANIGAADYVTETGKSGNWHYTKYNSGKVEAVGYVTFSTLTFSASGNIYRSTGNDFTFPSDIFTTAPNHVSAWLQGNALVYIGALVGSLTATGGQCQLWKTTSGSSSNITVHMHAIYTP